MRVINNIQIILEATTTADFTTPFSSAGNNSTLIKCANLSNNETVVLQTYSQLAYEQDPTTEGYINTGITLNSSIPYFNLYLVPGTYRVSKPVTINSVGVELEQNILNNKVVVI